jgi:hypothetical protein
MKLELKKIKYCKWMSEETHCYNAVVYVDGKAMISVSNEGHGGNNSEWAIKPFTQQDVDRVNAWCEKNLPKWEGFDGKMFPTDLEMWCGEEMNKYLTDKYLKKDFKRDLKSKILFVENKVLRQITFKKCKALTDAHFKYFKSKHPNLSALNFMTQDKAFKIYAQYMK